MPSIEQQNSVSSQGSGQGSGKGPFGKLAAALALFAIAGAGYWWFHKPQTQTNPTEQQADSASSTPDKAEAKDLTAKNDDAKPAEAKSSEKTVSKAEAPLAATPGAPQVAKTAAPSGCYEETFVHKKLSSHSDGEACLQHRNLITLQTSEPINAKTTCVKVNNRPVKFTRNPTAASEILIAAVAGPEAVIKIRYCVGSTSCKGAEANCTVPKDDFLAGLGADQGIADDFDDITAAAPNETWTKGAAKDKQAQAKIDRQLAAAKKLFETARNSKSKTFKEWMPDASTQPACQFRTGG